MIGKMLGHYQITSQLGKGGMGEVFQAKDQVLGREVAIKVLPEEFAKDADRVARFQREAKLLASLNHTNIAAIYGLEESAGTNFLVLELVEGQTLADRIKTGPIPVEGALKLSLQIAEALETAHEKGVIHRDLKPANIKVTPDGKVKVLDFGLAKAFAGDQEVNLSNSPTLSDMATQQGVILGTAAYMSPEQARGEAVDKKSDIWAFGCVLYEMLTGRGMFEGRTVSDTLAAVLMREPEWKQLPPNLHPRIRLLLERCLEKESKNRYSGIGDARVDIQKALADPGGVFVQSITAAEPRKKLRTVLPWVAAAIILGSIITGVAVWNHQPPEARQVTRLYYELPKGQQFSTLIEPTLAVSPDGRQFVYSTSAGLYLRSMDELTAKLIPGTSDNPQKPFFSPDGRWVGYWSAADRKLKKIAITGGAPVVLGDAGPGSFSWGEDDTIVYNQQSRGIVRISSNGGTPVVIVKEENEMVLHPQMLPDGKSVLFTLFPPTFKVMVQSLKTGKREELFDGDSAKYLSSGHVIYASGNNLFAVPFDTNTQKVNGGPVSVVEGVFRAGGAPQYAVSDSGTLVYMPGTTSAAAFPRRTLVWVDRNGKEEPLPIPANAYSNPRISPDGKKIALTVNTSDNPDIWIWDLVRKNLTRLTFDGKGSSPLWTPDGQRIVFASLNTPVVIDAKAADGTGEVEHLSSLSSRHLFPASWAIDGNTLALVESLLGFPQTDIGMLSMKNGGENKPLLQEKYNETQPQISPNGKWMAYISDESGRHEVYVCPFPDVNKGKWQVSTSGGDSPLWSPDGKELFYRSGDAAMALSVKTEPGFSLVGIPQILFRGMHVSYNFNPIPLELNTWDISSDNKRFLMIKSAPFPDEKSTTETPRVINIVLNWTEELKQRVPVK